MATLRKKKRQDRSGQRAKPQIRKKDFNGSWALCRITRQSYLVNIHRWVLFKVPFPFPNTVYIKWHRYVSIRLMTYWLIFATQKAKFDYLGADYLTYTLAMVFVFPPYHYRIPVCSLTIYWLGSWGHCVQSTHHTLQGNLSLGIESKTLFNGLGAFESLASISIDNTS